MVRAFYMTFAVICYAIFFAVFLYLIAFVGNFPQVPLTVDRGPMEAPSLAIPINLALIALFGLQHSVMARKGFKERWIRLVPKPIERSIYVLFSSAALALLFVGWHPLTGIIWAVDNGVGSTLLWVLFAAGWALVLTSTFLINHFELFGLQQAWFALRARAASAPKLHQPLFYKFVRHPLYCGFFLAFWATPYMTAGHLLLAVGMSIYMLIAIQLEERDLVDVFGSDYQAYRDKVGMLLPRFGGRS